MSQNSPDTPPLSEIKIDSTQSSTSWKDREWPWWLYLALGIFALAFVPYLYYDLTEFERTGETRWMAKMFALVYDIGGKWAVIGLEVLIGGLLITVGIWHYVDKKASVGDTQADLPKK